MKRLSALLLLGGAALLFTPAVASAQFVRPFGLPNGAPLTVPIVPPVGLVPTVPLVPPVPIVRPVIGFPQFRYEYRTEISFGNIRYSSQLSAFGPAAWAFRPGAVWGGSYNGAYSAPYMAGGSGAYVRPDIAYAASYEIAKAQRQASSPGSYGYGSSAGYGSGGPHTGVVPASGTTGAPEPRPNMNMDIQADPEPAAINSGEALNEVLKEIVRVEAKGAKGASPYIPALLLNDVRFAGSPAADLLNLARQADNLPFPAAFDTPALAGLRRDLDKDFYAVAAAVRAGKAPEPAKVTQLESTFGYVQGAIEPAIKKLSFEEATAARQFMNRMGSAIKAAKDRSANGLIDPKWVAEGLTVADLVKHMTRHKMVFGPAPRGSEDSYATLHRNLYAYLFVLSQPKK